VSTSETVTDISGRGVGMDAVKSYMEKLGGQMFIRFTGKQSNEGFQPFATLIQIPPQYLA
jgi:two-component system chemotaxis sensor kinase CheA